MGHVAEPRQAHVDELGPAVGGNQHVRGFDVAMDHVALAGVLQGLGDLVGVAEGFFQRQRSARLDEVANVDAVDVLEDDVVDAAIFADVVHAGDVVVVEPGGRLGLVAKAAQRLFVGRLVA